MLPTSHMVPTSLGFACVVMVMVVNLTDCPTAKAEAVPLASDTPVTPANPVLDIGHARRITRQIQQWVRQGQAPTPAPPPPPGVSTPAISNPDAPAMVVSQFAGMHITLRQLGQTLGQGSAISEPHQPRYDLTRYAALAAGRALADVRSQVLRLHKLATQKRAASDLSLEGQGNGGAGGDGGDGGSGISQADLLKQTWPLLTVDVQLAYTPRAIVFHRSRSVGPAQGNDPVFSYAQLRTVHALGFHGLAMFAPGQLRGVGTGGIPGAGVSGVSGVSEVSGGTPGGGGGGGAWRWPANNLASHYDLEAQVSYLIRKLGYRWPEDLAQIGMPGKLQLARFRVIHLTQSRPLSPMVQLIRGNQRLPISAINMPTLHAMVQRLTDYLLAQQTSDGSFLGTFIPASNQTLTPTASAHDMAYATYALAQSGQSMRRGTGEQTLVWAPGNTHIDRALRFLLPYLLDEKNPPQMQAMSWVLMSMLEHASSNDLHQQRDLLAKRLLSECERVLGVASKSDSNATEKPVAGQTSKMPRPATVLIHLKKKTTAAIHLAMLACLKHQASGRQPKYTQRLQQCVKPWHDVMLRHTRWPGPHRLIRLLPILMAVEDTLEQIGWENKQTPLRQAQIQKMFTQLVQRQIHSPWPLGPGDTAGGFDLSTQPQQQGAKTPTWRSAYGLEALAMHAKTPKDLLGCAQGLRYIAQLMFDQPSCYYIRDPASVVGGVRQSLEDHRLNIQATAAALIAACQTRDAIEAIAH